MFSVILFDKTSRFSYSLPCFFLRRTIAPPPRPTPFTPFPLLPLNPPALRIPHLSFSICRTRWPVAAAARGVLAPRSGTCPPRAAPTLAAAAPATATPPGGTPTVLPAAASAARAALPHAAGRGYGLQRQASMRTRTPCTAPSPWPRCVLFVVCFTIEHLLSFSEC